jgi:hypothetical protein
VGASEPDLTLKTYWAWYLAYLDEQIKESWNTVLVPVISDLRRDAPSDVGEEYFKQLARVYEVLVVIAGAIRSRQEISLDGIVNELVAKTFILPKAEINSAKQMVWLLAGELTMLYDPIVSHNQKYHGLLTLRQPQSSLRARGRHRGAVLARYSVDINKAEDQFHTMLRQFGPLIPEAEETRSSAVSLTGPGAHYDNNHLNLAYLNYHGLKLVAGVQIEWVNTMNLHLQLDEHNRILRLYRFPAFCRLLWRDNQESFLTK